MLLPLLTLGVLLSARPPADEKVFAPCPEASPEWTAARERLLALDARLETLPDGGDRKAGAKALRELLTSRCFAMSREEREPVPEDVSPLALKAWWKQGGRTWVESYLELGKPGARTVVLPPEARETLTRDSVKPDHRLASLLCAASDTACAKEMEGPYTRVDAAFLRALDRPDESSVAEAEAESRKGCEEDARTRPQRWRYTAWRGCEGGWTSFDKVLPVVRMRMPKDGWLVLRGRRGHHGFCDEVRAYHLGTGAAWVSQSCSDLALYDDAKRIGQVDVKTTNANRLARVRVGTLSVDSLRELTWVLLLADEAITVDRARPLTRTVPAGYPIEWRERPSGITTRGGGGGGSFWGNTGQTTLRWTWFPPEKAEPLSGELTWPESADPADDHADRLLVDAEKSFKEGCPSRPAPVDLLDFTRPASVNKRDAPEGVTSQQDDLVTALRDWRPSPGCAVTGK
ncbi:hypothetical protein HUA74_04440 [Myxococcus sp. CA051A]|uniref:hypothetical protein n=1 Tax=Myxococcus sp. CA051A TaxID=2741739 RepID=UPI00157B933A|nr:hypothetical protein [Myxococcus sp. CA051A]NTX59902.1 hypothetical protein [Myxococcus sp. CA051A]